MRQNYQVRFVSRPGSRGPRALLGNRDYFTEWGGGCLWQHRSDTDHILSSVWNPFDFARFIWLNSFSVCGEVNGQPDEINGIASFWWMDGQMDCLQVKCGISAPLVAPNKNKKGPQTLPMFNWHFCVKQSFVVQKWHITAFKSNNEKYYKERMKLI